MNQDQEFEFRYRLEQEQLGAKAANSEIQKTEPLSRMAKLGQGLKDPVTGGAQLLYNLLPKQVTQTGDAVNNWIAEKTGLLAPMPQGGMNELVQKEEQQYQAARKNAGETGFDGYRMTGNILNPANLAIASKIPMAAGLAGRVASSALGGAATSALNPVASGDYATEKMKQIGLGAAFGGAVPLATGALGRIVSPNASTSKQLALLKEEGVRPTIGQSLGGAANKAEEKMQMLPIFGDAISLARKRAETDLSRAAANRALKPLGQELPEGLVGNEATLHVRQTLGEAFDAVLPKMAVQQDKAYQQSVAELKKAVTSGAINGNTKKSFDRFLSDEVNPLFQGQQSMSGETFKRLQSKVTEKIQQTSASTNADERVLNGAYKELGEQLNQLSVRTNPELAPALKAINTGYANFKRLQKASSSVAAEDGVFSPAMLQSAVRALDKSKDKGRFSEGGALMQDLSSAGKNLLGNKVADSGTAGRLALGGGALAAGTLSPVIPLSLMGGAAMYTPAAQRLLSQVFTSRPDFAQPAAKMLRNSAPAFIPASAYFGSGLLSQP